MTLAMIGCAAGRTSSSCRAKELAQTPATGTAWDATGFCFADSYSRSKRALRQQGAGFEIGTQSRRTLSGSKKMSFVGTGSGAGFPSLWHAIFRIPDRIQGNLSARFLHDPQFVVRVNGQSR